MPPVASGKQILKPQEIWAFFAPCDLPFAQRYAPDVLFRARLMTLPGTGRDRVLPVVTDSLIPLAKMRERNGFGRINPCTGS